jgi:hypothetical protein
MIMNSAFSFNKKVESFLKEEPTVSFENILSRDQLQELKKIALEFLRVKDGEITGIADFWIRKGGIEHNEHIKKFSEEHLKKLLPRDDAILIGDTAFIVNFPPHDIHVDCRDFRMQEDRQGIIAYKSMVIPLEVTANEYPILYTADQYFYGPTTRFRSGSEQQDNNAEVHRQKSAGIQFSYDYQNNGMKYVSEQQLTQEWYDANIDANLHVPYSNFKGISIEKENLWKPGNIIVFDSARVHFGSNIKKKGAKFKIGLSLNYGIRVDI